MRAGPGDEDQVAPLHAVGWPTRPTGGSGWSAAVVVVGCVIGSVTVAVELATVIVMTSPPVLIVMVVGLATGVVSWLTTLVEPATTFSVGTMSPVIIAVFVAV